MRSVLSAACCGWLLVACGHGASDSGRPVETHGGAAGADAGSDEEQAGSSGAGDAGALLAGAGGVGESALGPLPCGSLTCGANQYCVQPCCGGAPPACVMKPDGGACPPGTHPGLCSNSGQCTNPGDCCQFDPCIPPPEYCADQFPIGCYGQGRSCRMTCG
jgi:hypothetical protein